MKASKFLVLGLILTCGLNAWEDHPDKEHAFDPDKTIPSSSNYSDHYRNDDSGRDSDRDDRSPEPSRGTVLDGPDRDN